MSVLAGRKRSQVQTTVWSVRIRDDLHKKVTLLLTDPKTGKVKYGATSQLTEQLLDNWLQEQIARFQKTQDLPQFEVDNSRFKGNKADDDSVQSTEA